MSQIFGNVILLLFALPDSTDNVVYRFSSPSGEVLHKCGLPAFALNINLEALNDLFDLLSSNPAFDLL
jgi:hypothetical protein